MTQKKYIEAVYTSGQPDPIQKRCYDCRHCKAAVSWWCTNEEAIKARGTAIPGVSQCPFWEPMLEASEVSRFKSVVRISLKETVQ